MRPRSPNSSRQFLLPRPEIPIAVPVQWTSPDTSSDPNEILALHGLSRFRWLCVPPPLRCGG